MAYTKGNIWPISHTSLSKIMKARKKIKRSYPRHSNIDIWHLCSKANAFLACMFYYSQQHFITSQKHETAINFEQFFWTEKAKSEPPFQHQRSQNTSLQYIASPPFPRRKSTKKRVEHLSFLTCIILQWYHHMSSSYQS